MPTTTIDALDLLIEEILDIARENPIDDARIIIRDRITKDAERAIRMSRVGKKVEGALR